VGAQAVYHHTGATTLNVPVMTTDADLALDTRLLSDDPEIGASLRGAGFVPEGNPGHWVGTGGVALDLMVVPYQANAQKQAARSARILDESTRDLAKPMLLRVAFVQRAAEV